jgi:hypothetical protein
MVSRKDAKSGFSIKLQIGLPDNPNTIVVGKRDLSPLSDHSKPGLA